MSTALDIARMVDDWGMRFQDPSIQKTTGENPRWYIRPVVPVVTPQGLRREQRRIVLGTCAEMTKKEAQREKQRIMAEINGGAGVIQGQLRLSDLITKFREARMPLLAESTRRKYDCHLRSHIADLGDARLHELTPDRIQGWLISLKMSSATRADVRNILSALFEQARRWRMWDQGNPVADVELGRLEPVRDKFIPTVEEVRALREALGCCGANTDGITGPDTRLILDTVIATGWRISEVLGLQHDAIEGPTLSMRRRWHRGDLSEVAKTRAGIRRNYVGEELAAELAARHGEFIFAGSSGNPPDDRSLQQYILRPCAEAVGCYRPGFGFHAFRRLNISWRAEAGAHPFEIARAAGHSRVDMSLAYSVASQEREAKVVNEIRGRVQ